MVYKKYKPSKALRSYVSDYYIWESDAKLSQPFSVTSSANNCFAMVFSYGDVYRLFNTKHQGTRLPTQFLSGQSTSAYTLHLQGKIGMAGIIFHGSAFRSLFRIPNPKEFIDDRIDLTVLLGKEADEITERLAEAPSHLRRIQILEAFLLKKMQHSNNELTIADRASARILHQRGMIRMDDLAQQLYVSPRQLRRKFKSRVGVNPKYFARLKRFNYVNWRLTLQQETSWQMFVQDDAFYDQSHFIKDYKEFFGKTPTVQILENRKIALELTS